MITLDTSGLVSFFVATDENHQSAKHTIEAEHGLLVVPNAILCEATYLLERGFGPRGSTVLLTEIVDGAFTLDSTESDIPRIIELVKRYEDLPLGYADAAVIACAERRGGRVLTFDLRHFGVVAREGRITIVP